jgi:hypothetical protein
VAEPAVRVVDGEVRVRARVDPTRLSGAEALREVAPLLPDVVTVELRGQVARAGRAAVEYRIHRAFVGSLPMPPTVLAGIVRSWPQGAASAGAVPDDGAPVLRAPWPFREGILRVEADRVVIERPEPMLVQSVDGSDGA